MRKKYQGYQRGLRKDLDDWLPELKALPKAEREGIDAIASAEMWFRLREEQELSKQRSIEVVVNLLGGLIPNTTPRPCSVLGRHVFMRKVDESVTSTLDVRLRVNVCRGQIA